METKTILTLWEDYLFLTQEMRKLLTSDPDMELFMELIDQRGRVQMMIAGQLNGDYIPTPAEKIVLTDIEGEDKAMRLRLQFLMNQLRSRGKLNQAYDAIGENYAGKRMDCWK